MLKSIRQLKNIKGKRVLVRVDFNVTIENGKVLDDFRIKKALPTILFLKEKGAKIILLSHIGSDGKESLKIAAKILQKHVPVRFVGSVFGNEVFDSIEKMKAGDVILLENLRSEPGETGNTSSFARGISRMGDMYVNDAFPVSHRAHASIVSLPKLLPSYAGFQFEEEIKNLEGASKNPKHPFLFILGGAKFETKIPLIKKYLNIADHVFIGGALANNFFKEEGHEIGLSLADNKNFGLKKLMRNKKLIIPVDVLVKNGNKTETTTPDDVSRTDIIVDIGPKSVALVESLIRESKAVLWNGPMGNYEKGFGKATENILKTLAKTKTESIVGGGDTVALISKLKLDKKLSFVSTGGGASLEFLAKGTLPGIEALRKS